MKEATTLLKGIDKVLAVEFSELPGFWTVDAEKSGQKFPIFIEEIAQTSGLSGTHIPPYLTENHNHTPGHIFATVVASAFNNGFTQRIPHRETFSGFSVGV